MLLSDVVSLGTVISADATPHDASIRKRSYSGVPVGTQYKSCYLHTLLLPRQSVGSILLSLPSMSKSEEHVSMVDMGKANVETSESIHKPISTVRGKDKAAELLAANERIVVTSAENKRVLRKIDLVILPILLSIYFLQSLDKTTLSYASVFGLIQDANLDPKSQQYSWLGSIVYIAQLVMQPIVAVLLVKLRMGKFMGVMVFTWGCILCGMAGAKSFGGLMATRFLLGAAEAAVGMFACHHSQQVQVLTCCSAGFHRCRPDVVQAR